MFSSFQGAKIKNNFELRIMNCKKPLSKTLSGFFISIISKLSNQQIAKSSYAFEVSDLKNTNPKPKVSIQWKGNIPKSFSFTALYNPKAKYSISKNSTIILGDSLVLIYLLFFQLSLSELMLNLGVRTNSLRLPLCPSSTAIVLWNENPKATEKKVKNNFT